MSQDPLNSTCFLPVNQSLVRKLERHHDQHSDHTPSEPSDDRLAHRRYSDISQAPSPHPTPVPPKLTDRSSLPVTQRPRPPPSFSSPRLDFTSSSQLPPTPSFTADASLSSPNLSPNPHTSSSVLRPRPRPLRLHHLSPPPLQPTSFTSPPSSPSSPSSTSSPSRRRRLSLLWNKLRSARPRNRPSATNNTKHHSSSNSTNIKASNNRYSPPASPPSSQRGSRRDWPGSFRPRRRLTGHSHDVQAPRPESRHAQPVQTLPPQKVSAHPSFTASSPALRHIGRRPRSSNTSFSSAATADTPSESVMRSTAAVAAIAGVTSSAATAAACVERAYEQCGVTTREARLRGSAGVATQRTSGFADAKERNSFAGFRGRYVFTTDGSSISSSSDREDEGASVAPGADEAQHLYLSRRQLRALHYHKWAS